MKNYKVCVYAIAKNEEKFAAKWADSMSEADKIIVLDTGSTDKTVEILKDKGVEVVVKEIKPWRFDVARNESLKLVPSDYDICVCTDLDEVLESGWKEKILKVWNDDVTRLKYTYNWSFNEYGNPETTFMLNKIHKNGLYYWTHPVHEVLTLKTDNQEIQKIKEKEILCPEIVLNHFPDRTKSRSSYLPLLELSVSEDPNDDRNMHYLGREYMYYGKWDKAIETLKQHLGLERATWKDERCASMRFIARCYKEKNDLESAKNWYRLAIKEAPYLRESYVELAFILYHENTEKSIIEAYKLLEEAFKIKEKSNSYINESFAWNSFIYDLNSLCAFKLKKYPEALENVKIALAMDKNNLRLQLNLEQMEKYV